VKIGNGLDVNVVDQIQVNGKQYFLVDLGTSRYINGVLTKYLVCPTQQFERQVTDKAEIV
jgi:hypothetical protein